MFGRIIRGLIAVLFLIASAATAVAPTAGSAADRGVETSYVIDFGSTLPADAEDVVSKAGGSVTTRLSQIGVLIASSSNRGFAARAQTNPEVHGVAVDSLVSWLGSADVSPQSDGSKTSDRALPPDSIYDSDGWNIKRVGGTRDGAWAVEKGNHSVVVAIMDTGIYSAHPDLAENYLYGRSFVEGENESDYNGHGTFVAGIVGGALGGGAIVGMGPGLGLASYKVLDRHGNGRWSWLLSAIYQAANDGVKVANMSLGAAVDMSTHDGQIVWQAFQRATRYADEHGMVLVAAGDNGGIDLRISDQAGMRYIPLELPRVIGVSATTRTDQLAFYSNRGSGIIDLAAPGGDLGPAYPASPNQSYLIWSAISPLALKGSLYARGAGTSFATPHVSGTAGLIASRYPGLSAVQIGNLLQKTADDLGAQGRDASFGFGLVDAQRALSGN